MYLSYAGLGDDMLEQTNKCRIFFNTLGSLRAPKRMASCDVVAEVRAQQQGHLALNHLSRQLRLKAYTCCRLVSHML